MLLPQNCILFLLSTSVSVLAFNIPIPFGGLSFTKAPDGSTHFGIGSNVDIGGSGFGSGLKFVSKNGSTQVQSGGDVMVDGKKFGTNSTFGVDNEGLTADTDIKTGKNTLHGGVGKESTFINDLIGAVKETGGSSSSTVKPGRAN